MKNLKKIIECRKGNRCNSPLSCKSCGEFWQKAKFKAFAESVMKVVNNNESLTYVVVKCNDICTLRQGLDKILSLLDDLRELKKRGKLPAIFSRLEVSFGKKNLGFNPHLNLLIWNDVATVRKLVLKHDLKFWMRSKENSVDVAKSIAWYMLKFNSIGIERGEAVRRVLNKRSTMFYTKEFNHKTLDYIDEFIDIDFSFLGVYPIRSQAEIELRKKIREERKRLNRKLKKLIVKERKKLELEIAKFSSPP